MEIHARHIAVAGRHGPLLRPTSLHVGTGQVALVGGAREESSAFALAISGRLATTTGAVLVDGRGAERGLRELVAVVDSPDVTEPEPGLPFSAVIAEELDHARQDAGRGAVARWLRRFGAERYARTRLDRVPASVRTPALTELAAATPGVRALVLDSPDRHGDDPTDWWPCVLEHARQGFAVVVVCAPAVARLMGVRAATIGTLDQPDPLRLTPEAPDASERTLTLPATAEGSS